MSDQGNPDSPPFPRHHYYYIALKLVVLAVGLVVAVYVFGLM